jgi:cobalamin biosynthesis Mg chelatase CobN
MVKRWVPLVVACCVAASAAPAAAQFTSAVIPPPSSGRDSLARIVARTDTMSRPSHAPDSSAAATLSSMKVWVDSVALAMGNRPPGAAADTTAAGAPVEAPSAGRTPSRSRDTVTTRVEAEGGEVTRFRNGAPAPETATPLPLLAVLGVVSVVAGALLRRR